ncbi:MAG: hypothetical protein GY768_03305 [Planctomycetaceae bacterium]|nr:hypothetical protein [Planctomycetaceae bacterium]
MARRESQGLQISLIVFVMLTVILAVTTYIFWNRSETLGQELTETKSKNAQLTSTARDASDNATQLKVWIGHSADTPLPEIKTQYEKDMQTFAGGLIEVERTYKELPAHLLKALQDRNEQIQTLNEQNNKLTADLKATETQLQSEVANWKKKQAETDANLKKTRDEFAGERNRLNQEKSSIAGQIDKTRNQLTNLRTKSTQEIEDLNKEVSNQRSIIQRRDEQLDEFTTLSFETPDGKIEWVNPKTGIVFLNLGSDDGLRPQVTFSVYGVDVNNLAQEERKATIEVTRIVNENLAEARITEDDADNPVMPADVIYTPLWNANSAMHFALAGSMDINDDGRDDREIVKRLILLNNGTIDAEEQGGEINGKMTHHTRYLIIGDRPSVGTDGVADTASQNAWTKMLNDATELGVEQISFDRLLDFIGYDGEKRTIPLGRNVRGADFEGSAESKEPSGSVFRQRKPLNRRQAVR